MDSVEHETVLLPGDVVLVHSGGVVGRLIRLGAALLDKPNIRNHVAIAHHVTAGVTWGIEGRPGGVGWVDMSAYIASPYSLANTEQPKTDAQRSQVAEIVESLLRVPYDWTAIAADAMRAIHADRLWRPKDFTPGDLAPGHVVCSSLADYAYSKAGLASPCKFDDDGIRLSTPADWDAFIEQEEWLRS